MLDHIKIALVKGDKGDVGRPTTKEIQDAIAENPSILVDLTTVANATTEWLDENGMLVGPEAITTDMIHLGAVKTEQIGEKAVTPAKLDRTYALDSEMKANACNKSDVTSYTMNSDMTGYSLSADYDGYVQVKVNAGTSYGGEPVTVSVKMIKDDDYDDYVTIGTIYADTAKTITNAWFVKKGTTVIVDKDTGITVDVKFYPMKF